MNNPHTPRYKRGTITKDGKLYGCYPDGSLYRIYSTSDRPFLQIVDVEGETFLRIRQATEQGYTDCPCPGAADLSYPSSALRRSRTVGGGKLVNALTAASGGICVFASQQYKQAGNSIVVDVLAHIYEQLFYPTPKPRKQEQLSLFDDLEDSLPALPPTEANAAEEKIFLTTFSGYDSQLMAADVLKEWHPDFRWTCKGWSDIDKYACQMHNLVFPQFADCALGDITKIDWHAVKRSLQGREVDLLTCSSPCQDISQAGKQMGLEEGSGTRSALLWYVIDAIEVLQPKYFLQENVAALVSKKFMPDFHKWLDKLSSLGYVSRWARLNAKNYGVPQNRDRVFLLSMRQDVAFDYQFPEPFELRTRLEDVLEEEVADRYFLKDDAVGKFLKANDSDNALFMQFDLPPTHEAAMFLKTLLQVWMEKQNDGWSKGIEWNEKELNYQRSTVTMLYEEFQKDHHYMDCHIWYGFEDLFKENMERKKE